MGSGLKISLTGLPEIKKALAEQKKAVDLPLKDTLNKLGLRIVNDAKSKVPVNNGALRNSISHKLEGTDLVIIVNAMYAAYVEFGTKKYAAKYVASLPADWQTYARTFQGKTGSENFDQFYEAILQWVKRKGIGGFTTKSGNFSKNKSSLEMQRNEAYVIAVRILQNGIKAQPYLKPAVDENLNNFDKEIAKLFSK